MDHLPTLLLGSAVFGGEKFSNGPKDGLGHGPSNHELHPRGGGGEFWGSG